MPEKVGNGGYLYSAKEVVIMPEQVIQWNCQNIIHRKGKTLIIGLTKTGKTILGIELAKGIVTGEPVFSFPTEKSIVLYAVLERYNDFQSKLKRMCQGINLDNLHVLDYSKKPLFLDTVDTKGRDTLKEAIDLVKADLVFLDAKYRTTSKKEADEEATMRWINNVDYLIDKTNAAIAAIHHSPKYEYEELVNKAAGSSMLSRWADVIIGIKRVGKERKDPRRLLEFVSNYGYEPDPIEVKITDTGMEATVDASSKLYEACQILEKEFSPNIPISKLIKDLADKHSISERTFWEARQLIK